jgi:hypothetical protein
LNYFFKGHANKFRSPDITHFPMQHMVP